LSQDFGKTSQLHNGLKKVSIVASNYEEYYLTAVQ